MIDSIKKLWNDTEMGRMKFLGRMLLFRLLFDLFGNMTYGTGWDFFFFVIYAIAQLFIVRARVRDFRGNVSNWTQLYGTGLVISGILVLIIDIPYFSVLAPTSHYSAIDFVFNKLMIFLIVYLSIYKVPKGGDMVMLPDFFQKSVQERITIKATDDSK